MDLSTAPRRPKLLDSKRINRVLFGVTYEDDIYEKFCRLAPRVMRAFAFRIDRGMRAHNLIFVHVPRVAGVSIAQALYGEGHTRHYSMRYFRTLDPGFAERAQSFALLRDPYDRFLSAYAFVRAGGSESTRLSDVFAAETAGIASVDDYLSYLERRDDFSLDFVMRRQSWFVSDLQTGAPLVKTLFLYGEDEATLARYLEPYGVKALPWLNRSRRAPMELGPRQRRRVEKIYVSDFALIEQVRNGRAR
jgi:Sulfotransferase family